METNEIGTAAGAKKPGAARKPVQQEVLRELGDIGKYRVRVVRAAQKTLMDVREYVKGANYEGFTRKGIRLGAAEAASLRGLLEQALAEGLLRA